MHGLGILGQAKSFLSSVSLLYCFTMGTGLTVFTAEEKPKLGNDGTTRLKAG